MNDLRNCYTTDEAADLLGVTSAAVRQSVKRNLLTPARRIGSNLIFTRAELARFNRSRRKPGRPKGER